MTSRRETFVAEAKLVLGRQTDQRAPGGAITVELCGHWEHQGECRWPHHTAIDATQAESTLRTVFVAPGAEEDEVRSRIAKALLGSEDWEVLETRAARPRPDDEELGARLSG